MTMHTSLSSLSHSVRRLSSPSSLFSLVFLFLVCLTFSSSFASALYEEQAGQVDWHVSHVGAVRSLLFRPAQSTAVVSTSENTLAAIHLANPTAMPASDNEAKNGDVAWRQVLPEGENLLALGHYTQVRVLTVSETPVGSATVRMWNAKDGSLVWDASFANPNQESTIEITQQALQQQKRRIQGVEAVEEARENPFSFSNADVLALADANSDGKSDVLALNDDTVVLFSGADGAQLWSWKKAGFQGFKLLIQNGQIAVVGQEAAGSVVVYVLNAQGKQVSTKSIPFTGTVTKRVLEVIPSSGFVLLLQSNSLTLVNVFDAKAKNVVLDVAKEGVKSASFFEILGATEAKVTYVAVFGSNQQLVVEISENGSSVKKSAAFLNEKGEDVEYALANNAETKQSELIRAALAKNKLSIQSFTLGSSTASKTIASGIPFGNRGGLKQMWVDVPAAASAKKGSLTPRILIACVDDSFSLVQDGKLVWTREEALASMTKLHFVELPVGSNDEDDESSGSYPNVVQRIVPQVKSIIGAVASLVNPTGAIEKVQAAMKNFEATLNGANAAGSANRYTTFARPISSASATALTQDYFGFRKLLLCSTESGKVYALESEKGQVVWSKFFRPHVKEDENEDDEVVTPLWKIIVLSHHEAVAIVHDDASAKASRKSHIIAFNPLTGDLIKGASIDLGFLVSTAVTLPFTDSHNRHVLLVSSAGGSQVGVFPNTQEVKEIVAKKASSVFFYTIDTESQVLQGFQLQASKSLEFSAMQTWLSRFPLGQEKIVAVSAKPSNEIVQSSVRVLGGGDGGYLWKYLNPNLIAVATVRLAPHEAGSAGASNLKVVPSLKRTTDPSVNLYLIDSITGDVLDKFVHRGCEGPVTLLQTENSILYHYYNSAAHQYELSVVELFENRDASKTSSNIGSVTPQSGSIFDGFTLASLSRLGQSSVQSFNSFTAAPPQSITQTFTFRSAIRTLGVTQTRRGISMKEFLVGLPSDQLYAMPKMLVDPRRPVAEPTQQDRMEGLIPYSAEVPVDPLRIVSHVHTIGHLKQITSFATLLESTSIVCANGIDLFCIRLTPSQTFDLLNEDFNSPFLIATVTAVFVAILLTRRMAKAKELKALWK